MIGRAAMGIAALALISGGRGYDYDNAYEEALRKRRASKPKPNLKRLRERAVMDPSRYAPRPKASKGKRLFRP